MTDISLDPSRSLHQKDQSTDAFRTVEGNGEDYLDLILDSNSTSSSPMSTLFDVEPARLSWDNGLNAEPAMLPQYPDDLFKEEAFDNFDMTTIPMSTLCDDYMFNTSDNTGTPSKAPFGGLIDFNTSSPRRVKSIEADLLLETPSQRQRQPRSGANTTNVTSQLSHMKMSPSSARSSLSECLPRKRKSCDSNISASSRSSPSPPASPVHKKASHNMIEKRYRTNLNDKISALRNAVPSLRAMMNRAEAQGEDALDDGLSSAQKLSKATILSKATEYIRHLERKNEKLSWENAELKDRVSRLETMVLNSVNTFADSDSNRFPP